MNRARENQLRKRIGDLRVAVEQLEAESASACRRARSRASYKRWAELSKRLTNAGDALSGALDVLDEGRRPF